MMKSLQGRSQDLTTLILFKYSRGEFDSGMLKYNGMILLGIILYKNLHVIQKSEHHKMEIGTKERGMYEELTVISAVYVR